MFLFNWIRKGTRDAVLAGVRDAAQLLAGQTDQDRDPEPDVILVLPPLPTYQALDAPKGAKAGKGTR